MNSIVLIGPSASGKSTVGRRLAHMLAWEFVDLDLLRDTWYPEFGIDRDAEQLALERGGFPALVSYWKPFELRSVERVLQEHPVNTVIAFGGGQSVYVEEADIRKAEGALSAASSVVLLMPDEIPERSIDILMERTRVHPEIVKVVDDIEAMLTDFRPVVQEQLASESNRRLATDIVITGEDDAEAVAMRVLGLVR